MTDLTQAWPRPSHPRPIAIIGAGAIVRTAHLPVYRRLGYPVAGVFDVNCAAARETAARCSTSTACSIRSTRRARLDGVVYDLAVPGDQILGILTTAARRVRRADAEADGARSRRSDAASRQIARDRELVAAVNLQLRFSPEHAGAARSDSRRACSATLVDIDVRDRHRSAVAQLDVSRRRAAARGAVSLDPLPRRDPLRSPASPRASTAAPSPHPELPRLRDTRSSIILDYGDRIRCSLVLNHTHRAGPRYRAS